jgi:hypothetical protein
MMGHHLLLSPCRSPSHAERRPKARHQSHTCDGNRQQANDRQGSEQPGQMWTRGLALLLGLHRLRRHRRNICWCRHVCTALQRLLCCTPADGCVVGGRWGWRCCRCCARSSCCYTSRRHPQAPGHCRGGQARAAGDSALHSTLAASVRVTHAGRGNALSQNKQTDTTLNGMLAGVRVVALSQNEGRCVAVRKE